MINRRIYLDYASITPIDPRVMREMSRYSTPAYANPSSLYKEGVEACRIMDDARTRLAQAIHAHADEIVFTASGTEANSLALDGVVRRARQQGISEPHIIISAIEHSSVRETALMLEKWGCKVSNIPVDKKGIVSLDDVRSAIRSETVLISIMTVNNEVGTVQPIKEITKIARSYRKESSIYPLVHTDAAQAYLHQGLFVEKLGIDLMTLDASKMYGPRGVACLYIRRGTPIEAIICGGGQENAMRSGTENLPGIVGFACAVDISCKGRDREEERLRGIRTFFVQKLLEIRSDIVINGSEGESQSPHILNISIPGIDNEYVLFQLDARGIACSTKSSCLVRGVSIENNTDEQESYVLKAMGADSRSSLRFSFGRWTRKRHIMATIRALKEILAT